LQYVTPKTPPIVLKKFNVDVVTPIIVTSTAFCPARIATATIYIKLEYEIFTMKVTIPIPTPMMNKNGMNSSCPVCNLNKELNPNPSANKEEPTIGKVL
jgi:hypothetical protein